MGVQIGFVKDGEENKRRMCGIEYEKNGFWGFLIVVGGLGGGRKLCDFPKIPY